MLEGCCLGLGIALCWGLLELLLPFSKGLLSAWSFSKDFPFLKGMEKSYISSMADQSGGSSSFTSPNLGPSFPDFLGGLVLSELEEDSSCFLSSSFSFQPFPRPSGACPSAPPSPPQSQDCFAQQGWTTACPPCQRPALLYILLWSGLTHLYFAFFQRPALDHLPGLGPPHAFFQRLASFQRQPFSKGTMAQLLLQALLSKLYPYIYIIYNSRYMGTI